MTESIAIQALEAHLRYFEWARTPGRLEDAYLMFLGYSGRAQADVTGQTPEDAMRALGYSPESMGYYARVEREMLDAAPTVAVSKDMLDVALYNAGIWWQTHSAEDVVGAAWSPATGDMEQVDIDVTEFPNWETLGFEADDEHLPTLTREMLPWQERPGFLWFEEPLPYPDFDVKILTTLSAQALPTVNIKAIAWQQVPSVTVKPGVVSPGVAILMYVEHPKTKMLTLLDFTGWAFNNDFEIDHGWKATLHDLTSESISSNDGLLDEDGNLRTNPHVAMIRLLLLSIWGIMTESVEIVRPPRAVHRRAERSGLSSYAENGDIRIITLRKFLDIAGSKKPKNHLAEEVQWSHRWIVRGHWAWRHCSQENADEGEINRKRVYIHPFIKGPEDRPLILKEKVYAVVR